MALNSNDTLIACIYVSLNTRTVELDKDLNRINGTISNNPEVEFTGGGGGSASQMLIEKSLMK